METKKNLFGLKLSELQDIVDSEGFPRFSAKQLTDWIYRKQICDFDLMSNLSLQQRIILKSKYTVSPNQFSQIAESVDGTKKYLFPIENSNSVEAVSIPDNERLTICISSQAGCTLGCKFCQTGKMKFGKNLTSSEILSQLTTLPDFEDITNIVFMGMGEPLLNFENVKNTVEILTSTWGFGMSKTRITLSTVGIIPELEKFMENPFCELAISLHNPFHEERLKIMPIENKYPISEVINSLKKIDSGELKKISFEYIVFKNYNHSNEHVNQIAKLLNGLPAKINLMNYHKIEGLDYESPSREEMEVFQQKLMQKGITTTIRKSKGIDIAAACGLLSTLKKESE